MATILVLAGCIAMAMGAPTGPDVKHVDYLMPEVQPHVPDTYLCLPIKMSNVPQYLVGFEPHANMDIAHHMLLYGCRTPGRTDHVWNCGEMASSDGNGFDRGPVCGSGSKIVYAWAMDAPSLNLPDDVGFKVGGGSDINWLVMQVHYKDVTSFIPPANGVDSSGITVKVQDTPTGKLAGVYLLGTGGSIPAHKSVYMESACRYKQNFDIHPFGYRTHAHTLGQVVSGYRIRDGRWTEIGRRSPKDPEMFYNVTTPGIDVTKGDILAARCTMKNDLDHTVWIGSTQNDEMCNFYVMYYVDGPTVIDDSNCFSAGPPHYFWKYDNTLPGLNIRAIPDTASVIPGTSEQIPMTSMPHLYPVKEQTDSSSVDDIFEDEELAQLDPEELRRLVYLLDRGPRQDMDDEYPY